MIVLFLLVMAVVFIFVRRRWERIRLSNLILKYFSQVGLFLLSIDVHTIDAQNLSTITNGLYVGNHLSYMDVLVICSLVPCCFVTSMEIKNTLGLGLICQMAGCLFVDRKSRVNLAKEVEELSLGLQNHLNVAIFPEATSTNGEQVLRFRRPLFMSAIASKRPVIPFCLNYRRVGADPIDRINRDKIFWYGDMDFIPHLWALSGSGGVQVQLHFMPPIHATPSDEPQDLAAASQAAVTAAFMPT
jgi:1-acyl-sn-glycerol-3-phosphate acyltransferase